MFICTIYAKNSSELHTLILTVMIYAMYTMYRARASFVPVSASRPDIKNPTNNREKQ